MMEGTMAERRRDLDPEAPRTAFVLSGGGNLAVSQVGMLRALLERDIIPDAVIGTSAGALNGAVVATSPSLNAIERLTEVWCSLRPGTVFPGGKLAQAWNLVSRDDHLFENDGLQAIIERAAPARTFEETVIPLRVVTTDLHSGEEVILACGPIAPALLASTALPGLFPPVRHDDRTLIDGAVTNAVPITHALAGSARRIYVLNVAGGGPVNRPVRSPLDVAVRAFNISRNQRFTLEMQHIPSDVDVILLPRPSDDRDLFDFSESIMLIDEAHHLAARAIDAAPALLTGREPRRRWWQRRRRDDREDVA
jgi:NTE family protein